MTGSSTPAEKLRAVFLAALMVGSVFAASMAFSGTVAAAGNVSFTANPDTAGNPADLTAGTTVGSEVSSFQNVQLDFSSVSSFDGDFSNVVKSDVDILVNGNTAGTVDTVSASNNGETLKVGLSNSKSVSKGDRVTVKISNNAFQNPSATGVFDGKVDLDPQSTGGQAAGPLVIGGDNTVLVDFADPSSPVIANNGENGNSPLPMKTAGETMVAAFKASNYDSNANLTVVNEYTGNGVSVSTDSTTKVNGVKWYIAKLSAAKASGLTTVDYYVNGKRVDTEDYTTAKYDLQVSPDSAIHGSTVMIQGSIYKYPGDLADGQTFGYSVYFNDNDGTPGNIEVSSSDVNDGTFITRETFNNYDDTFLNDFPSDGGTGPSYEVYIGNNPTAPPAPDDPNVGEDSITTRLNLTDTDTTPSPVIYNTSADTLGTFTNATQAISGYDLELRDPAGGTAKSTTTVADGSYAFTAVFDDAGTWNIATNEGGVVRYNAIDVQPQAANFTFRAPNGQIKNFNTKYQAVLRDNATGSILDLSNGGSTPVEGYINVTGEFKANSVSTADDNIIAVGPEDQEGTPNDPDDDTVDYFHVTTDSTADGVTFDAIPVTTTVTATLENDAGSNVAAGAEVKGTTDAATTPESPDYVGSEVVNAEVAGPINILNTATYDQGTGSQASGNNIFTDDGPSVIEVLPEPQFSFDRIRIQNGVRVGYDEFRTRSGMTQYYVTFELYDQNNEYIVPANDTDAGGDNKGIKGKLDRIEVSGLEANTILQSNPDGFDGLAESGIGNATTGSVVDFGAKYDVDDDGRDEYVIGITPTESVDKNEKLNVDIFVHGVGSKRYSIDATGLNISEFRVNGSTVDSVTTGTSPKLTAVLSAPYDNGAPINNGRVRLTKTWSGGKKSLNETDARASNIQKGEYKFSNVQVGTRGVDTDNDGVADTTADLTFTGYQYADVDDNSRADLEQDEVDRGALESLNIAPRPINLTFDAKNTSKYAGTGTNSFGEPQFTITQGVEYERLVFDLTYPNGTAVDLTDGINGEKLDLNDDIASKKTGAGFQFVRIDGPYENGKPEYARVWFNESASKPSEGHYVIGDIAGTASANYVSSADEDNDDQALSGDRLGLDPDDSFSFNDINDGVDQSAGNDLSGDTRSRDTYRLVVETPDLQFANYVNKSSGYFGVAKPDVQTNIIGSNDTNRLNHDLTDTFNGNDKIENVTTDIDRWYRVNATLTDAFGTPIDTSKFDETEIEDITDSYVGDINDFNGFGDTDDATVVFLSTLNNTVDNSGNLELNNESASFQFDIKPNNADISGEFDMDYNTEIHKTADNEWRFGIVPSSSFEDSPIGTRPIVQVYDQSGARLPVAGDTGNRILANDVTQTLRVEAFPSDPDDLPLPERNYQFNTNVDPIAENTVTTDTSLRGADQLVTDDYRNVSYPKGQLGFLTLTPTGTGDSIITLFDGAGFSVRNEDGSTIDFDVNRSNKQVSINLSSDSVTAGSSLTVTVTEEATGRPINLARVSLSDPNGNVVKTATTNASGIAVFDIADDATRGTYSVETRPAGFEPFETNVEVVRAAEVTINNQSTSGSTVTVASTFLNDGGFIVIHNESLNNGVVAGSVIGHSGYLEAGGHTNIQITLDQPISENQTLIAMAHTDNGNELYDFPGADGPYTVGGNPVTDSASITVETQDQITVPGASGPAQSTDNDPLLEDVNGDGSTGLFDALSYYNNRNSAAIQNNSAQFDFDGQGDVGTLFDALALYNEVSA